MPRLVSLGLLALLTLLLAPATRSGRLGAQQTPPDTAISARALEVFATTHVAVSALRDRYQAAFAEPRNKKPEVQLELRSKMQGELKELLKVNGLTEEEFARLTRRVASDTAARRSFEEVVARLEGKK
jgi:transketolase